MKAAIVIPTTNNFGVLVRCLESIFDYTAVNVFDGYRVIVVDNGSTDETPGYLKSLQDKGKPLTVITNKENVGFVRATNQGLKTLKPDEHAVLCNDDVQIVDGTWLDRYVQHLEDPTIGAVSGVTNYVMGLQAIGMSYQLPLQHTSHLLIYVLGLIRAEALAKLDLLDERFGLGGNDDLDYSIRLHEAGYKVMIDRRVFFIHYGSTTLLRTQTEADIKRYNEINQTTRKLLVDKWGQKKVDWLFELSDDLIEYQRRHTPKDEEEYGEAYYARFGHGGYQRNEFWLNEWKRIAKEIMDRVHIAHPVNVLDIGCAHGMLVEALRDAKVNAFGIDISQYAVDHARGDMRPYLMVDSVADHLFTADYDLITCIETLEHLTEEEGKKAIATMCAASSQILFSSTPIDKSEPTHKNVQPPTYWIKLFKEHGFELDVDYDGSFLTPWTMLFKRNGAQ